MVELGRAVRQPQAADVRGPLHPVPAERTFLKPTWNLPVHKTHFNKFERIEIRQCLLSDHNEIKPEINNNKDNWKILKYEKIKQHYKIAYGSKKKSQNILN